jgi:DNA-binding NarL/FixJ family response regulator
MAILSEDPSNGSPLMRQLPDTAVSDNTRLTPREMEVLAFLTVGKSNREIALELNISMSTVKNHLSSIYEKLYVSNRVQAGLVGLEILPLLRALAS